MDSTKEESLCALIGEKAGELISQSENIATIEQGLLDWLHAQGAKAFAQSLEVFDEALYAEREPHLTPQDKRERSLLTLFGEVKFSRRRYRGNICLLDEVLDIPAKERLSPAATRFVAKKATNTSYQKSVDEFEAFSKVTISKATVKRALKQTAKKLQTIREQSQQTPKHIKEVSLEQDGVFITCQRTKEQKRTDAAARAFKKRAKIEVSLSVVYEGKEGTKPKTKRKAAHHIGSALSTECMWEEVARYFEKHFEGVRIHSGSDGESKYQKTPDTLGSVHICYDPFHVWLRLKEFLGAEVGTEIYRLIKARHFQGAMWHLEGYFAHYNGKGDQVKAEGVSKAVRFLIKNNQAILAGLTYSLGTIEGSNSHVITARCKVWGGGWSKSGLEAMVQLRCAQANREAFPYLSRKHSHLTLEQKENVTTNAIRKYRKESAATAKPTYYHPVHIVDAELAHKFGVWDYGVS